MRIIIKLVSLSLVVFFLMSIGARVSAQPASLATCLARPIGEETPCLDGIWVLSEGTGTSASKRVLFSRQYGSLVVAVELVPGFLGDEPSAQPGYFGYERGSRVWAFCLSDRHLRELSTSFNVTSGTFLGAHPLDGSISQKQDTIEEGGEVFTRYWFSVDSETHPDVQFRLLMTLGKVDGVYRAHTEEFYEYWRENPAERPGRTLADFLKCLNKPEPATIDLSGYWISTSVLRRVLTLLVELGSRDLDQIRQDGRFLVLLSDAGIGMNGLGDSFLMGPPNLDIGCLDGPDIVLANNSADDGLMASKDQSGRRVYGRVVTFGEDSACYGRAFGIFDRSYPPTSPRYIGIGYESKCRVGPFGASVPSE